MTLIFIFQYPKILDMKLISCLYHPSSPFLLCRDSIYLSHQSPLLSKLNITPSLISSLQSLMASASVEDKRLM